MSQKVSKSQILNNSIFTSVFVIINNNFDEFAIPTVMGLCNTIGRIGHISTPILGEYITEPIYFLTTVGIIGFITNLLVVSCRSEIKNKM